MRFRSLPASLSRRHLPDRAFYNAFYTALVEAGIPAWYMRHQRSKAEWMNKQWPAAQRVLSLGAGFGAIEQRLAELGHHVIANEPDLASNRCLHPKLAWRGGEFPAAFADRPDVDVILLHHLVAAVSADRASVLLQACADYPAREVWILGVADPSWPRAQVRRWRTWRRMRANLQDWQCHAIVRTTAELNRLVRRAGLRVVRSEYAVRTADEEEYLVVCAPPTSGRRQTSAAESAR